MKLIALEEHYTTPPIAAAWAGLPPSLQDPMTSMSAGASELESRLMDLGETRLKTWTIAGSTCRCSR